MGYLIAAVIAFIRVRLMNWLKITGASLLLAPYIDDLLDYLGESEGFADVITGGVNAALVTALAPHGLTLTFSNITDTDAVKADLYQFAIGLINDKIGADFSDIDWETVDKDEILLRLSRVVVDKINTETGAELGDIWPVDVARDSVGAEVVRQMVDGSAVGLIPQDAIAQIEEKIFQRSPEYKGIDTPSPLREAVMNRKRQERWRKKSKQVWVTR